MIGLSLRVERLAEEIKREVSDILRRSKDPRIGFISITDTEVSRDLRHAKVFFSILGDEEAKRQTVEGLASAAGFIRTELGKRIRLRHVPELEFHFDPSLERGARIDRILREIHGEADGGSGRDEGTSGP